MTGRCDGRPPGRSGSRRSRSGARPLPAPPAAARAGAAGGGRGGAGRGELDCAAGHFALALEFEPRLAEAENGLGLVAVRRGDWTRAEERFRAALALNEDLAEAHLNLAAALVHRDAEADALVEARAALAIDPGYADARLLTGELLLRLGRLEDARWELEKLCAAAPERADAHAANALRSRASGARPPPSRRCAGRWPSTPNCPPPTGRGPRSSAARAIWKPRPESSKWSSRPTPGSGRRRSAGARHHRRGARLWAEAARELEALLEAAPRRAEVQFAMAFVALARGEWRAAVHAADAALALRTPYPEARLVRAEALARLAGGRGASRARQVSGRGAAGDGGRTRPRRTQAVHAEFAT